MTAKAGDMRNKLKKIHDQFLVAHWDSKIIQLMSGKVQNRLAICISVPNKISGQFIASPEIGSGSGKNMANAVLDSLKVEMDNQVQAVVFDTTSSNSGHKKGSVTIFEDKLKCFLLWLACRHHIS